MRLEMHSCPFLITVPAMTNQVCVRDKVVTGSVLISTCAEVIAVEVVVKNAAYTLAKLYTGASQGSAVWSL